MSTGLGRLHFVPALHSLLDAGVDIEVIQGWVPPDSLDPLVNLGGRLIGRRRLASGMAHRRMSFLSPGKMYSCAVAEFAGQGLFFLNRLGWMARGRAAKLAWDLFGRSSRKYMRDQRIFHVRSGAGRGGAIARARELGLKVVVDHSIAHPAFMERALRAEFQRAGLPFWMGPSDPFWRAVIEDCEQADLLLVNSNFVRQTFMDEGYPADRIHVSYLGVREDFHRLKTSYERKDTLELLFTGGFGIRKGAQYLLSALHLLSEQGLNYRLTVAGAWDEARTLVDDAGLGDRVRCVGFLPQDSLKDYLAHADIYVFPSLAEGCASSGMEAMAAGLPVIATVESGLPIVDGVDGVLVAAGDASALARSIEELADDSRKRASLGTAAARKIASTFKWSDYAASVGCAYEMLLRGEMNED